MSEHTFKVGDRVTVAHPSFSGSVYVIRGFSTLFVEVSPATDAKRGHANYSFGVKAEDLREVVTMEDPTMKALWADIGNYYQGDKRAWAFVNHVVNGLPYA